MVSKLLGVADRRGMTGAFVLACLLVAAIPAAAEVDPAVEALQEAVLELQTKVENQDEELHQQALRLKEAEDARKEAEADAAAATEAETDSGNGFAQFFDVVELNSWINVNYTYNSRGNGNDHLIGQNSNTGFHDDNHTVQVDQLWFELDKPVNSESRAGFHADIAFGETARSDIGFAGNDAVTVYTAYLSYLAPLAYSGVRFDAGEVWTLIGAEVVPAGQNWNITRGLVWNLQPVSNTGVLATTMLGPVSVTAGFVNTVLTDAATDSDRNKALTGQIAYAGDAIEIRGSVIWGSEQGELEEGDVPLDPDEADCPCFLENNDKNEFDLAIFDLVIAGDPVEDLSMVFNFDYVWSHPGHGVPNTDTWGASLAARYAFSEMTGAAMRFDVVVVNPSDARSEDEYSITTTIDRLLTDNLTLRGEMRFDWGVDGKYKKAGTPYSADRGSNHQNLFLVEAIYSF